MAVDLKYLSTLLANGVSQSQAAAAVGCTPSYVNQLIDSNNDLQRYIQEEEAVIAVATLARTKNLSSIEKDLLERVSELVPYSDSLGEATTALQRISEMKERRSVHNKGRTTGSNVIELNLGKIAQAKIEVSMGDNNVIMHLGDTNMARAPANVVKDMIKARKVTQDEKLKKYEEYTETEEGVFWDVPEPNASGM